MGAAATPELLQSPGGAGRGVPCEGLALPFLTKHLLDAYVQQVPRRRGPGTEPARGAVRQPGTTAGGDEGRTPPGTLKG